MQTVIVCILVCPRGTKSTKQLRDCRKQNANLNVSCRRLGLGRRVLLVYRRTTACFLLCHVSSLVIIRLIWLFAISCDKRLAVINSLLLVFTLRLLWDPSLIYTEKFQMLVDDCFNRSNAQGQLFHEPSRK